MYQLYHLRHAITLDMSARYETVLKSAAYCIIGTMVLERFDSSLTMALIVPITSLFQHAQVPMAHLYFMAIVEVQSTVNECIDSSLIKHRSSPQFTNSMKLVIPLHFIS